MEGEKTRTGQLVQMIPTEEFLYNSYNQLAILQNNIETVFGGIPLIVELCGIFTIGLNLFLAVRFQDLSALLKALLFLYVDLMYFSRLAQVYTSSLEVMRSWKEKGQGSRRSGGTVFGKFQKSARPLRMSIGNFFFIDKPFILTLVGIMVTQTVNLIISYN